MPIIEAPTITSLPAEAYGAVVVSGSHGGRYPGYLAAKAKVRAVVFSDAGVGRGGAGLASLADLERLGIAAAAVSHTSARIGDPADMMRRGVVSHANAPAQAVGVEKGMACSEAAQRLLLAELVEVWSAGPARLFGLAPRKGAITPGADADLAVIDPEQTTLLTAESNYGPIGYNPYAGMAVRGVPVLTVRRGQVVVENGRYLGRPGEGRFLPRAPADTQLPPKQA